VQQIEQQIENAKAKMREIKSLGEKEKQLKQQ